MSMPRDLVLIRHGESEGNVATDADKAGDGSFHNDEFVTTPGHRWRLTPLGRAQAAAIGAWAAGLWNGEPFDDLFVSPYVRTCETAGHLSLPGARWLINRALRERDWGDIGSMRREAFAAEHPRNAQIREIDPLYWVPPGGESIAQVAEDRVRNVLGTLHRECSGRRVIAVTHGEFMWAMRLILERWDDEEFVRNDEDHAYKIHNCHAFHYTRVDPATGAIADRLNFVRSAYPVADGGGWRIEESDWHALSKPRLTNEELLASVAKVQSLLPLS